MRRGISGVVATLVAAVGLTLAAPAASAATPYRAFMDTGYWNTPLPLDAPRHQDSDQILSYLKADNSTNYVLLSGTDSTGRWGQPVYWAEAGDPSYNVTTTRYNLPSAFSNIRIPRGAKPDPTPDAEMTVYDLERGYVIGMYHAEYNSSTDTWTAGGGEIFYLGSNGLDGKLSQSDDSRNGGNHRGLPPPSFAIRYDEIQAGLLGHVMKIGVNSTKNQNVFPMIGHENGTTSTYAPAEGARIRIRPGVNLATLGLSAPALVIATALQRYGAVIGDQTGGPVELKMENTIAEGRGHKWNGVVTSSSLSAIPLSMYEVIEYAYEPPAVSDVVDPVDDPDPAADDPTATIEPDPNTEDPQIGVSVVRPRRRVLSAGRRVAIRWETTPEDAQWVRVRIRVRGKATRTVRAQMEDTGRVRWRVSKALRGHRVRVRVIVADSAGERSIGRSRWFVVR